MSKLCFGTLREDDLWVFSICFAIGTAIMYWPFLRLSRQRSILSVRAKLAFAGTKGNVRCHSVLLLFSKSVQLRDLLGTRAVMGMAIILGIRPLGHALHVHARHTWHWVKRCLSLDVIGGTMRTKVDGI